MNRCSRMNDHNGCCFLPTNSISKWSDLGSRIQANFGLSKAGLTGLAAAEKRQLFSPKSDHDFLVVAAKNYLAVFNPFDRDLVNLGAELEAEYLAFGHGLTVDDREVG